MATRDAVLTPLDTPLLPLEQRYLRKAIRYRIWLANPQAEQASDLGLGFRITPPSGHNTTQGIAPQRRRELDNIADWILQVER